MARWLESGRRLLTMFEKLTVVGADASPHELTPELEARLRRLESELPRARAADERES